MNDEQMQATLHWDPHVSISHKSASGSAAKMKGVRHEMRDSISGDSCATL